MTETPLGWASIESWKKGDPLVEYDPDYSEDPKEIILPPNQTFTIIIEYPSSIKCEFSFYTSDGISREDFMEFIVKKYRELNINNAIDAYTFSGLYLYSYKIKDNTLTIGVDNP